MFSRHALRVRMPPRSGPRLQGAQLTQIALAGKQALYQIVSASRLPLDEHPLFRRLSGLIADHIRETTDVSRPFVPTRQDRPEETYLRHCFMASAEVVQLLHQMSFTPAFLSSFRATPRLRAAGVTRFEFLVYQLENWFIRCTALSDRALILVNTVCRLGFRPQDCKLNLVTTNSRVAGSAISAAVKALDKHVNTVRPMRNSIAHQHRLRQEGWGDLEGLALVMQSDPSIVSPHYLKRELDRAVAERRAEIETFLATAISKTGHLLAALATRFEAEYKALAI